MATTALDIIKIIVEGVFKLLQTPAFLIAVGLILVTLGVMNRDSVLTFLHDAVGIVKELK